MGKFISFVYAVLDPATGKVVYCNCGHNPPIVHRASGADEQLEAGGTLLGISSKARFSEGELTLGRGDCLVLYTDGVTEAVVSGGEEYGTQRLLARIALRNSLSQAKAVLDAVLHDVTAHCKNSLEDDATCVVVALDPAEVGQIHPARVRIAGTE